MPTIKLPRLSGTPIVDKMGSPVRYFMRYLDEAFTAIEQSLNGVTNALSAAGVAQSTADTAQATADAANGALSGYEPHDVDLTAIAGLAPTNDDFLQRKSGAWANRTVAQVRTDLISAGNGVALSSGAISVDLATSPGLEFSTAKLRLKAESTGGTGSAGTGKQYVEVKIGGVSYKLLHDN